MVVLTNVVGKSFICSRRRNHILSLYDDCSALYTERGHF